MADSPSYLPSLSDLPNTPTTVQEMIELVESMRDEGLLCRDSTGNYWRLPLGSNGALNSILISDINVEGYGKPWLYGTGGRTITSLTQSENDFISVGGASIVTIGDDIYFFGGYSHDLNISTDVIYHATTSNPTSISDTGKRMPSVIQNGQFAIGLDAVWMFGGYVNNGGVGETVDYIYRAPLSDPTNWVDTGRTMPIPVDSSSCMIINEHIYIFGGRYHKSSSGQPQTTYDKIWRAPLTNPFSWREVGTLATPLDGSSFLAVNDAIYSFSGYIGGGYTNKIYSAPISDPLSWTDTGDVFPLSTALKGRGFTTSTSVYFFTSGKIYRSYKSNPTSFSLVGSFDGHSPLNTAAIGNNVFLYGISNGYTDKIFYAPIA